MFLHHGIMHSNGTPTNLDSIQDQIVVLATYLDKAQNGERATQSAIEVATTYANANLRYTSVI
jgi:hypothetical protein